MARRNDHTREELTNLILQTIKEFLSSHSYHELSLRKVANMVGYVPSTLVNLFGSYNLLLLHVVAQTMDELSLEAQQAINQATDHRDSLFQLANCYHSFALNNPYRWQLIFEHNMNGDELPDWQMKRIDGMTGILEDLLTQMEPQRNHSEILQCSRVLWAGVHGITLLSVDDKFFTSEPIDGKLLINNLLTTYLNNW